MVEAIIGSGARFALTNSGRYARTTISLGRSRLMASSGVGSETRRFFLLCRPHPVAPRRPRRNRDAKRAAGGPPTDPVPSPTSLGRDLGSGCRYATAKRPSVPGIRRQMRSPPGLALPHRPELEGGDRPRQPEKKTPLRSRPITAATVLVVSAGSETKLNPACCADQATVTLLNMNEPVKP
jgi:hypothetical protein